MTLRRRRAEVGASDARGLLLAGEGPVFCAGHDFGDMADAASRRCATCSRSAPS